jgi:xylan 1,4-beta-xylosidase
MHNTILRLLTLFATFQIATAQVRTITADINKIKGTTNRFYSKCVGAGRANEGLRADWQQQLAQTKKECGFEFIRFHGLLHDDMGVYTEDAKGNPIYNWFYIDQLYDYILSIGMKPFVELTFMPTALASGEKTIFWWKGNITPPKSYEKYSSLIFEMTKHFTERYGKVEVKTWRFEVWNEPNLDFFFSGSQQEYFKLYSETVKAIKKVSPEYLVGGPATAGVAWIPQQLDYCKKNNVPIDFIATHTYGVAGFLDELGTQQLRMIKDSSSVVKDIVKVRRQIDSTSYKGLEMHMTEWNSSYSPRDPVHDTYQNAAYIAYILKNTEKCNTSMSYWTFTDIFEEPGAPVSPFHGGFGLLTREGLKKPSYYVYQFLNKLGNNEIVNTDKNSWITKDPKGNIQLLVYDFDLPDQGQESNQSYFKKVLPPKKQYKLQLDLTGLNGNYKMVTTRVGFEVNDVYTAYAKAGSPHDINKALMTKFKSMENTIESSKTVTIKNGKFVGDLVIRENDVLFVELIKQ